MASKNRLAGAALAPPSPTSSNGPSFVPRGQHYAVYGRCSRFSDSVLTLAFSSGDESPGSLK